jgi:hypothetical protein
VKLVEQQQSQHGTKQRISRVRKTARVRIVGDPDLEALTSVIDEWLVPLLVREFLATHPFAMRKSDVNSNGRTTRVLVKEGVASRCVQEL